MGGPQGRESKRRREQKGKARKAAAKVEPASGAGSFRSAPVTAEADEFEEIAVETEPEEFEEIKVESEDESPRPRLMKSQILDRAVAGIAAVTAQSKKKAVKPKWEAKEESDGLLNHVSGQRTASVPCPKPTQYECVQCTLDSGATHSVLPVATLDILPLLKPEGPEGFRTASGAWIPNIGSRKFTMVTQDGKCLKAAFHVADVWRPLLSATQCAKAGNTITMNARGAIITNDKTGATLTCPSGGGTPQFSFWVSRFQRQAARPGVRPICCRDHVSLNLLTSPDGSSARKVSLPKAVSPMSHFGAEKLGAGNWRPVLCPQGESADSAPALQEEGQEARPIARPHQPTPEMIAAHEVSHVPYRNWCRACVAGRGRAYSHRPSIQTSSTPVISMDYLYFNEPSSGSGSSLPTLVLRDGMSKAIFSHLLPAKGTQGSTYPEKAVLKDLNFLGYRRLVLKHDQEPSIKALARTVKAGFEGEVLPEESPKGDAHGQSNGAAERAVQTCQGLVRTLKAHLERPIGSSFSVLAWMVEHAGTLHTLYSQEGAEGLTPFQRIKGRKWQIACHVSAKSLTIAREPKTSWKAAGTKESSWVFASQALKRSSELKTASSSSKAFAESRRAINTMLQ